jgi:hypothetical protein
MTRARSHRPCRAVLTQGGEDEPPGLRHRGRRRIDDQARLVIDRDYYAWDDEGLHEGTDTRAIDNFIVRKYLEDRPASPQFLLTVRGVGYKFQPDAPKNAH